MTNIPPITHGFQKGEALVLARGTYPGTRGTFLRLRDDVSWAEIQESDGNIRSHPVAWLERAPEAIAP